MAGRGRLWVSAFQDTAALAKASMLSSKEPKRLSSFGLWEHPNLEDYWPSPSFRE